MTIVQRPQRIQELDGWRAVSVALVILHHLLTFQYPKLLAKFPIEASISYYAGPLGVKIFFVISGFVICRLLIIEEATTGSVSLKAFYCRRFFRIIPPLYLYLVMVAILFSAGLIQDKVSAIVTSGLFLNDAHFMVPWFMGHTWSLAVEEQFYLVFPTMWIVTQPRWRNRVFLATFTFCVAWNQLLSFSNWGSTVPGKTRAGFACICCGVLMAISEARARRMAAKIPPYIVAIMMLILLLHPLHVNSPAKSLYDGLVTPLFIAFVLIYSIEKGHWLQFFLRSKPLQAVGLMSYGIYLWQQLFTAPFENYFRVGRVIPYLLPLLLVIVPASYFLLEKPAMRLGKKFTQNIGKPASMPAIVTT